MRSSLYAIAASIFLAAPVLGSYSGYTYQRTLTIDHTKVSTMSATLSDFTIVVTTNGVYASTSTSGGRLNGNGFDLGYSTMSDCSFLLFWDTETVNASGSGTRNDWVKIPSISSTTDTTFYQCYGNPAITTYQGRSTSAWDSNYLGVWHFPDGTTLGVKDSTVNGNNGTNNSGTAGTGQVDGALALSGSSQYVTTGITSTLGDLTIEMWIKPHATGTGYYRAADKTYNSGFWVGHDGTNQVGWGGGIEESVAPYGTFTAVSDDVWTHLAMSRSGTSKSLYKNGLTAVLSTVASTNLSATALYFGVQNDLTAGTYFNGSIDEIRLSNSARSAAWVQTEYNNQNSPTTFTTLGAENVINCPSGYSYYRPIVIDYTKVSTMSATLTDIPILVRTNNVTLSTQTGSGGRLTGSGFDIKFTSSDASSSIFFDTETVNNTGSATLNAWVKVPVISSTAYTTFYVFYGNSGITSYNSTASSVWDSNYKGVWHLPNGTTISAKDSTTNATNGTVNSATASAGQIDGGITVSGGSEVSIPNSSAIQVDAGDLTASVWFNRTTATSYDALFDKPGTSPRSLSFFINGTTEVYFGIGNIDVDKTGLSGWTSGTWHYMSMTRSGSNVTIYLDGVQNGTASNGGTTDAGNALSLGKNTSGGGTNWNGLIDEFRLSNIPRSAAWIQTEYNNQNSPSTFALFGQEASCGTTPPPSGPSNIIYFGNPI